MLTVVAPKERDSGVRVSVAADAPMPVSVATWVPASSVTASDPVRVPVAVGAKAMETVQPVWAARVVPQVFAFSM